MIDNYAEQALSDLCQAIHGEIHVPMRRRDMAVSPCCLHRAHEEQPQKNTRRMIARHGSETGSVSTAAKSVVRS